MLDAAERIATYVDGMTELSFIDDLLVFDAVCMNLVRIGEAANLLLPETTEQEIGIPWRRIVDMRHRIAHGYAGLDVSVVWSVATAGVPELAAVVRRMLSKV